MRSPAGVLNPLGRRNLGFTLIELVAVVVILGLLLGVFAPRFLSRESATLRVQAEAFAYDVRRAQMLAVAQGVRICLKLESNLKAYSLNRLPASGSTCNQSPAVPLVDPTLNSPIAGALTDDVAFASQPTSDLIFDSLGKPLAPVTYSLVLKDKTKQITVDSLTGRISIIQ